MVLVVVDRDQHTTKYKGHGNTVSLQAMSLQGHGNAVSLQAMSLQGHGNTVSLLYPTVT
ncbi:hypothetical protein [Tychonema sp. BBK16]|uniref:hypothetical protein n=1 Tax=Tychonema sp. BBK16 TaxID=2699888 RepID=UPI001F45C705|nr:hypothetical protein [Tychonema sp. BBK16]MCF6373281.1 hypothetical protein [Tychonema sp. BBK16]